jgi:hypothetical protein
MSHINEKLGLGRAGKRAMMQLPKTLADRTRITSAQCPACQRRDQRASKTKGAGWLYYPHCNNVWELSTTATGGE